MPSPASPKPMGAVRSVLLLGSLTAVGPLSMDMYMPSLPDLAVDLGTSASAAQLTMSASMLGLGIGQVIAGPLSDRLGRRRPVLVGTFLFALLSLACAFTPNVEVLIGLRTLQGLAGAVGVVVARAVVRDLYEGRELARMYSRLLLVMGTAPILAPVVGGQLARVTDWRGIFVVLAGVGLVLFIASAIFHRETLPAAQRHTSGLAAVWGSFAVLLRDRLFLGLMLLMGAAGVVFKSYLTLSSFVLQGEFGLTVAQFSIIFAANSLALIAASQMNALLVRRVGPDRVLGVALTGSLAASGWMMGASFGAAGLGWFLLGLSTVIFLRGVIDPNITALARQEHGVRAGMAAGLIGVLSFLVGPFVAPLSSLAGATSAVLSTTMTVFSAVAVLLMFAMVVPELRRRRYDSGFELGHGIDPAGSRAGR